MPKKITFNADEKKRQRTESEITIGGVVFHPRPKTNRTMADWIEKTPVDAGDTDTNDKSALKANLATVFDQVAVLLVDDSGEVADSEHVRDHLDIEDANDLLAMLAPGADEVAAQGDS